jgi:hypothetical protein
MKNLIVEKNMTRYDLLFGEYTDVAYGQTMCSVTWLKNGGRGGHTLTWEKGGHLYAHYICEKVDINLADLSGILSAIKEMYPDSIGELMGFNESYM